MRPCYWNEEGSRQPTIPTGIHKARKATNTPAKNNMCLLVLRDSWACTDCKSASNQFTIALVILVIIWVIIFRHLEIDHLITILVIISGFICSSFNYLSPNPRFGHHFGLHVSQFNSHPQILVLVIISGFIFSHLILHPQIHHHFGHHFGLHLFFI